MNALYLLELKIPDCRKCPRIVKSLKGIKKEHPDHWCRPVPGIGNTQAKIMIVGLAPGRLGANITGRMFTGDQSGSFLYAALRKTGFVTKEDELGPCEFRNLFITAAMRCFPPQNKPLKEELHNCLPYLEQELDLLKKVRVIVALGKIGHDAAVEAIQKKTGEPLKKLPFKHGQVIRFKSGTYSLLDSYHVSPQNTFTKKLTPKMFKNILKKSLQLAK